MPGVQQLQIRQVIDANGKTGFDITVKNGKEVALVKAHLEKKGEDFTIDLEEAGRSGFRWPANLCRCNEDRHGAGG